jgi:hypothetical protein
LPAARNQGVSRQIAPAGGWHSRSIRQLLAGRGDRSGSGARLRVFSQPSPPLRAAGRLRAGSPETSRIISPMVSRSGKMSSARDRTARSRASSSGRNDERWLISLVISASCRCRRGASAKGTAAAISKSGPPYRESAPIGPGRGARKLAPQRSLASGRGPTDARQAKHHADCRWVRLLLLAPRFPR